MKISFFFSQVKFQQPKLRYSKKKNIVEDVSLSLRKEQLSKSKGFLPKPTEKCWLKTAEHKNPVQKSQFGCCQPFFDKKF